MKAAVLVPPNLTGKTLKIVTRDFGCNCNNKETPAEYVINAIKSMTKEQIQEVLNCLFAYFDWSKYLKVVDDVPSEAEQQQNPHTFYFVEQQ